MASSVGTLKKRAATNLQVNGSPKVRRNTKGGGKSECSKRGSKSSGIDMNYQQVTAVGRNSPLDIVHPSYMHLHPPANEEEIDEDEEEQTFAHFVEYGKRNPNATGTGRWKLAKKRNKILILVVEPGGGEQSMFTTSELKQYIEAFFQLDADCAELGMGTIDIGNKRINLNSPSRSSHMSSHPLRLLDLNSKAKKSKKSKPAYALDVFSLFDALVQLVVEPYISCLALINYKLAEEWDSSITEVLGRACGDRICCVSLPCHDSKREIFWTSTHELLHTIGFDHCTSFHCIMNAFNSLEKATLFLSPPNLRKLKNFHNIPDFDNGAFLIKHYKELLYVVRDFDALSTENREFERDCIWLESKINALKQIFPE